MLNAPSTQPREDLDDITFVVGTPRPEVRSTAESEKLHAESMDVIAEYASALRTKAAKRDGTVNPDEIREETIRLAKMAKLALSKKKEGQCDPEQIAVILNALSEASGSMVYKNQRLSELCARIIGAEKRRDTGRLSDFLAEAAELKIAHEREKIGCILNPDSNVTDIYINAENFVNKLAVAIRNMSETDINYNNANQIAVILESMTGIRWTGDRFIQYVLRLKDTIRINSTRKRAALLVDMVRRDNVKSAQA